MSSIDKINYIKKEIQDVNDTYLRNAVYIFSDYNQETNTRKEYKGRQIYELMQNADDCHTSDACDIKIKFTLINNLLIVQNNGLPFSERGVTSLMHPNASSKHKNTIGFKGLGFRSVLNWANDISIYTTDFNVHFSEKRAVEMLDYYKKHTDKTNIDDLYKIDRVAILSTAQVDNDVEERKKYLEEGYVTSIVLRCDERYVDDIQKQLSELKFEELLFLKHIQGIIIDSPKAKREIVSIKFSDDDLCGIQEGEEITWWRVWRKEDFLDNNKEKRYELAIAYNDNKEIREHIRRHGTLYSYFKTDMPMPLPFLIHGTFDLSGDRNKLDKNNKDNGLLLDILYEFIVDKSLYIASLSSECSYEPIILALPYKEVYYLDNEYNFTNNLKERIKKRNVFPTINNEYISLDDKPRYTDTRFDELLNPKTFNKLLKHCDDEKVRNFLYECRISMYPWNEFCELINIDGQEYVSSKSNSKIIKCYADEYRNLPTYGPLLLEDNEGKWINDKKAKIFNNPSNAYEPPNWSQMRFINGDLEERLSKEFDLGGRELVRRLSIYNLVEYSFDRVAGELNRQCDNVTKVKELIKWLFDNWVDGGYSFPSTLATVDLKLIDRDQNITLCSNCHFGNEYSNYMGEGIILHSNSEASFLADISDWDVFNGIEHGLVVEFFKYIGVRKYPRIESVELSGDEIKEYLDYNSERFELLHTDSGENRTKDDFLQRIGLTHVVVDTIKGIDSILENCSFEQIVSWILNDRDLYNHILNDTEINNSSMIRGNPKSSVNVRTVRNSYMRSWLKKVFSETKWIPAKNGTITNASNLVFKDYDLSPIVETIAIDYKKIFSLLGRKNKGEVDALFEYLGVVEDFSCLPKEKIYETLLILPSIDDSDYSKGKNIYSELNSAYGADVVDELIADNPKYDEFKEKGLVLARADKKTGYLPHDEVYYVENKIYSSDIISKFPTLVLSRRAGKDKIEKMLCVSPIERTIKAKITGQTPHQLNDAFQTHYKMLLPYIYAKRVSKDNKNRDFNSLRKTKINLVKDAVVEYQSNSKTIKGNLIDYELLLSGDNAVIKVPQYIQTLDELKSSQSFRCAFAETITTIFRVDANNDAYQIILGCKDVSDLEKYFRDSDETLVSLNKAKKMFDSEISYKDEFWKDLAFCVDEDERLLISEYGYLFSDDFDYIRPNPKVIIELFTKLGIDLDNYNSSALSSIHLVEYFYEKFTTLKNTYREKYLIYQLLNSGDELTKQQYEEIKSNYDFKEIEIVDSIHTNVDELFESAYQINTSTLDATEGDLSVLVANLKEDVNETNPQVEQQPKEKEELDYLELFNQVAAITTEDPVDVETESTDPSHRHGKHTGHHTGGKVYDPSITKKKEYVGFVAESAVYALLVKEVGDSGTVQWLSGNGGLAHKCVSGDDTLGYDMRYVKNGVVHYVEVKGTSGKTVEFNLSKNEYEFGDRNKNNYELWFVFVGEEEVAPKNLGNIFVFNGNESFFHNSKFTVEQSEFKIKAKIIETSKE